MACNGLFGAGAGSQIAPPDPARRFSIRKAEVAVIDRKVHELLMDFDIIIGMAKVKCFIFIIEPIVSRCSSSIY